jgi:hypothetical protein
VKNERRQKLSSAEWERITSRRPMVRRIPAPKHSYTSQTPETGEDCLALRTGAIPQTIGEKDLGHRDK